MLMKADISNENVISLNAVDIAPMGARQYVGTVTSNPGPV